MIACIRIFLLISFFLFFPSCGKKKITTQPKKKILRTSIHSDILSLDPRKHTNIMTHGVTRSLFAGLTYLGEDLTPQLDLAKSCTISEDLKTYTFHLRDSKWSDGSAITAKDFEESWKSLLKPAFTSGHTNPLKSIKNGEKVFSKNCGVEELGISAPNDKTLIVKLEKPTPQFLDIISSVIYYPVHKSVRSSEINDPTSIINSGPFFLKNYTLHNKIILEKNPYFWDAKKILLEEIQFFIINNKQTALFMFENKELDFFSEVTTKMVPTAIPSLKSKNQFTQVDVAGTVFLFLNTQKFPLTNVNIRKALSYAIDRKSIMENILYMDSSNPALGIIPKIIKKDRWPYYFQDHDVQKAKACLDKGLEELGITKEKFPSITMTHSGNTAPPGLMEAVQQMWENTLEIHIHCQSLESSVFLNQLRNKNYEIGRLGKSISLNDPVEFLNSFTSKNSKTGHSGWSSEKYNQEATAAEESNTMEERWEHIKNAEKIFCDEMPAIPLLNATASYVKHPYVKGVVVNSLFTLNFRRASIE